MVNGLFRPTPARQVAIVVLCLANPVPALAQSNSAAVVNGRVMPPTETDLTTKVSLCLAVFETECRRTSWVPVAVAHETAPLDPQELATLDLRLAAFEEDGPEAAAEEADWRNRIGLILGATTRDGHTGATIGLEYERRLSDLIGVGAVAEVTPNGREFVGAVPVFFHPVGGLGLSIGPGFSIEDGHAHFLVRFGIGWDFELHEGLSLAPTVSYDLTEGTDDAIVYGLMVSFTF